MEKIEECVNESREVHEFIVLIKKSMVRINSAMKDVEKHLSLVEHDTMDPYDHITASLRLLKVVIDETD